MRWQWSDLTFIHLKNNNHLNNKMWRSHVSKSFEYSKALKTPGNNWWMEWDRVRVTTTAFPMNNHRQLCSSHTHIFRCEFARTNDSNRKIKAERLERDHVLSSQCIVVDEELVVRFFFFFCRLVSRASSFCPFNVRYRIQPKRKCVWK